MVSTKSRLRLIILGILFILNMISAKSVLGDDYVLNYKPTYNIGAAYYHINQYALKYDGPIYSAVRNWMYPGSGMSNGLWLTRTYNASESDITFYNYNSFDNYNGYTKFFNNGSSVNPDYSQWSYNSIYLNDYYLNSKSVTYKQGVAAHELGHAFGLDEHNTSKYYIMCQAGSGRVTYTVHSEDNRLFNLIH